MKRSLTVSSAACLALLGACVFTSPVVGQVTFDFQDGTDQGFGSGFGDDASASFSIVNIGGSLRMFVPRTGFQVASVGHGADASAFYMTMSGAAGNEVDFTISYDWYVDTSAFGAGAGNYFQIGTYVNTGSGYYAQHFPDVGKEVELDGAQLASGQVFSGTVVFNMAAVGFDMPTGDTFYRFGLIQNGDGPAQGAYFDNISINFVPEPTSLSLLGLGSAAFMVFRRRKI